MNFTLELLHLIGSPFTTTDTPKINKEMALALNQLSIKNRMHFLFLNVLSKKFYLDKLDIVHIQQEKERKRTLDIISILSEILSDKNIRHAIFKTIRPYVSTTVDIDVIIFGGKDSFTKAVDALSTAGFELIVNGPRSTTLRDRKTQIGIDLYYEVAVSYLIYVDKDKLHNQICHRKLPNNRTIKSLTPEADLACIIAHSIIKEQLYTLSEYYTFLHYLESLDAQSFIKIIKENNLSNATKTHANLTALLHKKAHGFVPLKLLEIIKTLGKENLETARITKNCLKTPHKYHSLTVMRSILEIMKAKKTRYSIANQITNMANPYFVNKFIADLIKHIKRETY